MKLFSLHRGVRMAEIRMATPDDAEQMLAIYAPSVTGNAVSFEVSVPSVAEFQQRVATLSERYPWLVGELEGRVVGFAYGSPFSEREAYRWSADSSVYIDSAFRRRGIGLALYTSLFACLRLQGYFNVFAGITTPNPPSEALHRRMGFEPVGTYAHVGYKLGAWHGVWWGQLTLQALTPAPEPPRSVSDAAGTPAWRDAIAEGQRLLG